MINCPDKDILNKLKAALLHRGPDEQDVYSDNSSVALVHTRLSIQDVQHGQQPFHYASYSIVFNGQIYNHLALRKQYLQEFVFKTESDTETLLLMYVKFQAALFQYLDGMFAFVILDRTQNCLFMARDRAGKKPLYYYQEKGIFGFASELNAIRAAFDVSVNHDAIYSILRCSFTYGCYTPYHEVRELLAGHYLTVNLTDLSTQVFPYFDLLSFYQEPKLDLSLNEAIESVDVALKKSVQSRLESSELEVGAFLSGGIDSSLVVAMAAEHQTRLKTFTIKFAGNYDESSLARLTANRYNTEHTEIEITMQVEKDLEQILLNYGEPFIDSSAIPSYYVAQEAKKHVTVVLNGDGADELFGGYRRYVPIANGWMSYADKLSWLTHILPKPHQKQSQYTYLYRLLTMAKKKGLAFQTSSVQDAFDDYYVFPENVIDIEADQYIRHIQSLKNLSQLDKKLYLDFNINLFADLLVKMDIATMAHALEARSPFLSTELLMLAPRLPDAYKINGTTTKFVLRQLAKKYLPAALIDQPKRGFEVPLKSWLDNELNDKLNGYLRGVPKVSAYVDKLFIKNLLDRKIGVPDEKRAKMLWALLATEIWLIDQAKG